MNFYEKEEYTIEDIQWLIDNKIEENFQLDFKANGSLGKSEGKKKEISKDVSAFANSTGGIIIYGLTEQNHVAKSFSFINGNEFTKEWLEHIINSNVFKRINGLKIYTIRNNNELLQSIYVVKVPESLDSPHMARDGRFYKRFNFESLMLQEFEVRQLYLKQKSTELEIQEIEISEGHLHDQDYEKIIEYGGGIELLRKFGGETPKTIKVIGYDVSIKVRNIGDTAEDNAKLLIKCPILSINGKPQKETKLSVINSPIYKRISNRNNFTDTLSIDIDSTIFPDEVFEVWKFSFICSEINRDYIESNPFIELRLYYSSGYKQKILKINELFKHEGKHLDSNIFDG